MQVKASLYIDQVMAKSREGSVAALYKAASYLRESVHRMIRPGQKSSKPGQPPKSHTGFRDSISFEVDENNMTVVIGPHRIQSKRTNSAGQTVPSVLEHGGASMPWSNRRWWKRKQGAIRDESGMQQFFLAIGYGPGYWAFDKDTLLNRITTKDGKRRSNVVHGGRRGRYIRYKRYSPLKRKDVYLTNISVKSAKAAKRVAKTVIGLFGWPVYSKTKLIEARPYMEPAFRKAEPYIMRLFQGSIKP